MSAKVIVLLSFLTLCVRFGVCNENSSNGDDGQMSKQIIQQAFKNLMNMNDVPTWAPASSHLKSAKKRPKLRNSKRRRRQQKAPKYMLDLYKKYRDSKESKQITVTSIQPIKGRIRGVSMLVFNVSGVQFDERITRSELHFYRRRKSRHRSRSRTNSPKRQRSFMIELYDISDQKLVMLDTVYLDNDTVDSVQKGWNVRNVTDATVQCRQNPYGHSLMGLKFQMSTSRSTKTILPRRVLSKHVTPFLIVFSHNPKPSAGNGDVVTRLKRYIPDNEILKYTKMTSTNLKASVYDKNDLPDLVPVKKIKVPRSHVDVLEPRKKSNKIDPGIIPVPKHMREKKKWRQRTNGRKKKMKSGERRLPEEWLHGGGSHVERDQNERVQCLRKTMSIDFAEIGWDEWIISPKSFEANYCSGGCPFPLNKGHGASNHATIQSIVHAMGRRSEVPAPSCVPKAMSSLTLLYFNQDNSVVLRNYPNMIAHSCSCQ